jgi:hypothetical protein
MRRNVPSSLRKFGRWRPNVHDVATRQYGFLLISALGGWAYFHGWRLARNP